MDCARVVLRLYQQAAVDAVTELAAVGGLVPAVGGRFSVVMACGTGKTLVALRTVEKLLASCSVPLRVVLFFPTLGLLEQTYQYWQVHASVGFRALAVCSQKIKGSEDISLADVSIAHTTNPEELHIWLSDTDQGATTHTEHTESALHTELPVVSVVFATYQSASVIADAHRDYGLKSWSIMVCDEAHRTAGVQGQPFSLVLDDDHIPATTRLFYTATPKIHATNTTGSEGESLVALMDDENLYGKIVFTYSTRQAINDGYLAPYKIAVIGVTHSEIKEYSRSSRGITTSIDEDGNEILTRGNHSKNANTHNNPTRTTLMPMQASDIASIMALKTAVQDYGITNALAFLTPLPLPNNLPTPLMS